MDPMSVWELEAGRPRYHVPRFQLMADSSSASTIASPADWPLCTRSSTGNSFTIPMATAIPPRNTPRNFRTPERATAYRGGMEFV
jgi:hypothetical protein